MKIHVLGICGTFMAGLAHLARESGHEVRGSDKNVYPPMSEFLRHAGIEVLDGWQPAALDAETDLVVIGNALSRGNPMVEAVLDRGLPYTSGAEWVATHILRQRQVIAVAGTHGKTTTASMVAWLLEAAGLQPGFLIGGIPNNFGVPARLGNGRYFVIEADEYDTAFFDKRSKFVHYRPAIAILNNLEFDHADIFPDLAAIQTQFHHLLRTVPSTGTVIWNADEPSLQDVIARGCWSRQIRFGRTRGDWVLRLDRPRAYSIEPPSGPSQALTLAASGLHNAFNATAALAAVEVAGLELPVALTGLAGFQGVRRRLELRGMVNDIAIYDDFAHHPTAIAATIEALRSTAGKSRVLAVLEPRSNTMRAGVHKTSLGAALAGADLVYVYQPENLSWDLHAATATLGRRCKIFSSIGDLVAALSIESRAGDAVLIMSNGGFDNIHERLLTNLRSVAVASTQ